MKLTIKRQTLLKMLNYANQAIPAKSAENQFLNFLIIVSAEKVSIVASDGTLSTKVEQEAKDDKGKDVILNEEDGMIQVPAKYLLDIVSKLGGDVVTLNMVDTNYLNISDDATNFNLVTKDGREYPDIDLNLPEESHGFTVPLKDIRKLYETTAYAVATKGPKEIYYGINVSVRNGKLYFLTTDSYRMARYAVEEKGEEKEVETILYLPDGSWIESEQEIEKGENEYSYAYYEKGASEPWREVEFEREVEGMEGESEIQIREGETTTSCSFEYRGEAMADRFFAEYEMESPSDEEEASCLVERLEKGHRYTFVEEDGGPVLGTIEIV